MESSEQFETRKRDHIRFALDNKNEATGRSGLDAVQLWHEALPELEFSSVRLHHRVLNQDLPTPFLVSSMTAGHREALGLNLRMAELCSQQGWMMGVGSQRRELRDPDASKEWQEIRKSAPKARLLGNIGISQLISTELDQIRRLAEGLEAMAMIVHTNPLQECLQPEGTPQFAGGLLALERLCAGLTIPVVLKETGCGFSASTLERLRNVGLAAVDVSGFGGTHWGRVEGARSEPHSVQARAAQTFADWGVSTVESLNLAVAAKLPYEVWGSGGARSGLDAAKLVALGANAVGFAKPILQAAIEGSKALESCMQTIEFELKCALFCTGCASIDERQRRRPWRWVKIS